MELGITSASTMTGDLTVVNSKGEVKEGIPIENLAAKPHGKYPKVKTEIFINSEKYIVVYVNEGKWFSCAPVGHTNVLQVGQTFEFGEYEYCVTVSNNVKRRFTSIPMN